MASVVGPVSWGPSLLARNGGWAWPRLNRAHTFRGFPSEVTCGDIIVNTLL